MRKGQAQKGRFLPGCLPLTRDVYQPPAFTPIFLLQHSPHAQGDTQRSLDTYRCARGARETTRTRRTLQKEKRGRHVISVGESCVGEVCFYCGNHSCPASSLGLKFQKWPFTSQSSLHLPLAGPSWAFLFWIPAPFPLPSLLPLVAHHGARHGNSS